MSPIPQHVLLGVTSVDISMELLAIVAVALPPVLLLRGVCFNTTKILLFLLPLHCKKSDAIFHKGFKQMHQDGGIYLKDLRIIFK